MLKFYSKKGLPYHIELKHEFQCSDFWAFKAWSTGVNMMDIDKSVHLPGR